MRLKRYALLLTSCVFLLGLAGSVGAQPWYVSGSFHANPWGQGLQMSDADNDGVYTLQTRVATPNAAGQYYEFKIKGNTWDTSYPSSNVRFQVTQSGGEDVTFWFDTRNQTGRIPAQHVVNCSHVVAPKPGAVGGWVLVGDFQGANWNPANGLLLQYDAAADEFYQTATIATAGAHEAKFTADFRWDLHQFGGDGWGINASNISYTTTRANQQMKFVLDPETGTARVVSMQQDSAWVQAIHNSADITSDTIDVYMNGVLTLDNFAFRTATPFIRVPAGVDLNVQAAPRNSTSAAEAFYSQTVNFAADQNYIVMAIGLRDPSQYAPNPVATTDRSARLLIIPNARRQAVDPTKVEVLLVHGITDLPPVVVVDTDNSNTVVGSLAGGFGTTSASYISLTPRLYRFGVSLPTTPNSPINRYEVDYTNAAGKVMVAFASGFFDAEVNRYGRAGHVFTAEPTGAMAQFTRATNIQTIHFMHNPANCLTSYEGLSIRVEGIVTAAKQFGNNGPMHIAGGGTGLSAFGISAYNMQIGDMVAVYGTFGHFNGLQQFSPTTRVDIISSGNPLPAPVRLTLLDLQNSQLAELYEGAYVRIARVRLTNPAQWTANSSATITDENGITGVLRIDGDTDVNEGAAPTDWFDLYGILGQFDNTAADGWCSGYQILPRIYSEDIRPASESSVHCPPNTPMAMLNATEDTAVVTWTSPATDCVNPSLLYFYHYDPFATNLFFSNLRARVGVLFTPKAQWGSFRLSDVRESLYNRNGGASAPAWIDGTHTVRIYRNNNGQPGEMLAEVIDTDLPNNVLAQTLFSYQNFDFAADNLTFSAGEPFWVVWEGTPATINNVNISGPFPLVALNTTPTLSRTYVSDGGEFTPLAATYQNNSYAPNAIILAYIQLADGSRIPVAQSDVDAAAASANPVRLTDLSYDAFNGIGAISSNTPAYRQTGGSQTSQVLESYTVWRNQNNGEFTALGTITGLRFVDTTVEAGAGYCYRIVANYSDGMSSDPTADVCVGASVNEDLCPPRHLEAEGDDAEGHIALTWEPPLDVCSGATGWIHWDNDENADAIGSSTSELTFIPAARFDADDMAPYSGGQLTQMRVWFNASNATYTLKVWEGGDATGPGDEVLSQAVTPPAQPGFVEYTLNEPITIQAGMEYWIGYEITSPAAVYGAGVDAGPTVEGKGDWIGFDGDWVALGDLIANFQGNWNIQGYIAAGSGAPQARWIAPKARQAQTKAIQTTPKFTGQLSLAGLGRTVEMPASMRNQPASTQALTGYKVWRNGEVIAEVDNETLTYTDADENLMSNVEYCYQISAVYDEGNSPASNEACASVSLPGLCPPQNLSVTGNTDEPSVMVMWEAPAADCDPSSGALLFDDFEDYPDFSIDFDPWTLNDVDGLNTYGFTGLQFPHSGEPMSYIVFNANSTTPEPVENAEAFSGDKQLACFASVPAGGVINNDWLITPQLNLGANSRVVFKARSFTDQYGLERFKVLVSTTGTQPSNFTAVSTGNYVQAPVAWTEFSYNLSAYDNQTVYIAVQCVSSDAFIFFLDDFAVYSDGGSVLGRPAAKKDQTPAEIQTLTGYEVWRDGEMIAQVDENTLMYTDESVETNHTYCYEVRAAYDNGFSNPAGPECADMTVADVCPPINTQAVNNAEESRIDVAWDAPLINCSGGSSGWIHWDDGVNASAIGFTNGGTFSVAVRFDAVDMAPYIGGEVTRMKAFFNDPEATYTLKIWQGGNGTTAGTEVLSQDVDAPAAPEYGEFVLENPVTIEAGVEYWFGYELTHGAGTFPAGYAAGPLVSGKGDWITLGGVWGALSEALAGFDGNWNIQALVEATGGRPLGVAAPIVHKALQPDVAALKARRAIFNGHDWSTEIASAPFIPRETKSVTVSRQDTPAEVQAELTGYKVWRDGSLVDEVGVDVLEYHDTDVTDGTEYCYTITAVYDNGALESEPSAEACATYMSCVATATDHNNGAVQLSVTNKGSYGWMNEFPPDGAGVGFIVRNSNRLFEGSLIISAFDDGEHISDQMRGGNATGTFDEDFQYLSCQEEVVNGTEQKFVGASFNDANAESPFGIHVEQTTYSYSDADNDDYVIVALELSNPTQDPLVAVRVGMYLDFDVNADANDRGGYYTIPHPLGSDQEVAWLGTSLSATTGTRCSVVPLSQNHYTGVRILDNRNEVDQTPEASKLLFISERDTDAPTTAVDLALGFGLEPFDLMPGESHTVGFAFVGAQGQAAFNTAVTAAINKWLSLGYTSVGIEGGDGSTADIPTKYAVKQNFPNPFNPSTAIQYALPKAGDVTLQVYNSAGQLVKTLVNGQKPAGNHQVQWDGTNDSGEGVASGVYFYRINAGDFSESKKMMLLK